MLSFMREQDFEDSSDRQPLTDGKVDDGKAEETREQGYLTVASKSKNVRKTTCLLAVLFVVGLLGLLFMIKKSAPKTATADAVSTAEARIEMAISRLTGIKSEMFNRMDQIVKRFYEFSDVQQIKVNELAKNPFERDAFWGDLRKISNAEKENPDTDADLMRQRLNRQVKQLQLLCIMQSAQGNCCMIDGKILYVGDSIKGFTVRQIEDSFVGLEWNQTQAENIEAGKNRLGTRIILKLSE